VCLGLVVVRMEPLSHTIYNFASKCKNGSANAILNIVIDLWCEYAQRMWDGEKSTRPCFLLRRIKSFVWWYMLGYMRFIDKFSYALLS
jgi:hypothetical protein